MLDPKLLRNDPESVAKVLAKKGFTLDIEKIRNLESARQEAQVKAEALQQERNKKSKSIGTARAAGEDIEPLLKEVEHLKGELAKAEQQLAAVQEEWDALMDGIPNLPADDVPAGTSEEDNVEVRKWGQPRQFDFPIKDHVDLGDALGQMDFDMAAKLSGARF